MAVNFRYSCIKDYIQALNELRTLIVETGIDGDAQEVLRLEEQLTELEAELHQFRRISGVFSNDPSHPKA